MNNSLTPFEQIIYKEINDPKLITSTNHKLKICGGLIFFVICISVIIFIITGVYIKSRTITYIVLMCIAGGEIIIVFLFSFILIFINNRKIKKYFQKIFDQKQFLFFNQYSLIEQEYLITQINDHQIKLSFNNIEKIIDIKPKKIQFHLIKYKSYYESALLLVTKDIAAHIENTIKTNLW